MRLRRLAWAAAELKSGGERLVIDMLIDPGMFAGEPFYRTREDAATELVSLGARRGRHVELLAPGVWIDLAAVVPQPAGC